MSEIQFLSDLAIVMLVAGVTTLVFHRLRQPVLLGYILAGILIGPHTPGVLVDNPRTIGDISNLGVVLLLFTLGLDFSVRKLREVGVGVLIATVGEVGLMLWLGYGMGRAFGWDSTDSLFTGAIVALSSTMVVSRTLAATNLKNMPIARTVIGMLVGEDILTIVLLTLLTGVAVGGSVQADAALSVIGHLGMFVVVGMVLGLLLVPRLIDRVAGYGHNEILLIVVLGICFGASLLAVRLGFSVALGAFLAGVVVAESRSAARVVHLVAPLRDMFAALFFVAIGLRIDPTILLDYAAPALIIALVVIVGKTVMVSLGMFTTGQGSRNALRAGLNMAVIGEFSFVIATLGLTLDATSDFLYPIAVGVSVVCMAVSPYLMRSADRIIDGLQRVVPASVADVAGRYTQWLQNVRPVSENAAIAAMFRRFLWHIGVNVVLVIALFVLGAYVNAHNWQWFSRMGVSRQLRHGIIWALALFLSLPMLIAVYRKAGALGMLLAELGISERFAGEYTHAMRHVLAQLIPAATLLGLALLVGALGSTILPSWGVVITLLGIGIGTALFLWRRLVKVHAHVQATLHDTIYNNESEQIDNKHDSR